MYPITANLGDRLLLATAMLAIVANHGEDDTSQAAAPLVQEFFLQYCEDTVAEDSRLEFLLKMCDNFALESIYRLLVDTSTGFEANVLTELTRAIEGDATFSLVTPIAQQHLRKLFLNKELSLCRDIVKSLPDNELVTTIRRLLMTQTQNQSLAQRAEKLIMDFAAEPE